MVIGRYPARCPDGIVRGFVEQLAQRIRRTRWRTRPSRVLKTMRSSKRRIDDQVDRRQFVVKREDGFKMVAARCAVFEVDAPVQEISRRPWRCR